jgi:hypothetical protein
MIYGLIAQNRGTAGIFQTRSDIGELGETVTRREISESD